MQTLRSRRSFLLFVHVLLGFVLSGLTGFAVSAAAQQTKPQEYQVKAVYLYNFGRFVEWPPSSAGDESFVICVLGQDPFGAALDSTVAGEMIDDRKLVARRIAAPGDAAGCRILFISSSEAAHLKDILALVNKTTVLTVSDLPGFSDSGGMIEFVLQENKVRFRVNLAAAEKAGLTLSSQLLKVATDIKK
jgi:YfiR/HmsC-like